MSRIIKFRAWDSDAKRWAMADDITLRSTLTELALIEKDSLKIMQFTELRDKAGREVYEGDILQDRFDLTGTVEYRDTFFCIRWQKDIGGYTKGIWSRLKFGAKVIGNRWENPELLGGAERD